MNVYKLWLIVVSKNDHGVGMHSAYRYGIICMQTGMLRSKRARVKITR